MDTDKSQRCSQYLPQDSESVVIVDNVVLHYSVATKDMTALAAEFHEVAYNATTNVASSTLIAASGTLTKTAGATYAVTLTPATELKSQQNSIAQLEITSTTQDTTVFKLIGLDIYYTPAGE